MYFFSNLADKSDPDENSSETDDNSQVSNMILHIFDTKSVTIP